jgi:UPF0755 protein
MPAILAQTSFFDRRAVLRGPRGAGLGRQQGAGLLALFASLLGALAVLAALLALLLLRPVFDDGPEREFDVAAGSGLRAIAQRLGEQGTGVSPTLFWIAAQLSGQSRRIKAGSYVLKPGESVWQLVDKLARGEQTLATLTLVEGQTWRQFKALIQRHGHLRAEAVSLPDADIARALGLPEGASLEGWFFPDTYAFARRSSDWLVLKRAHEAMKLKLQAAWSARAADSPLATPYELLILASIVEKETGRADDRPLVASVFANRLRLGMRLQTDPSVIYGLGERFDGNLRRRDLQADTPYNTYTRAGLPPTPIAMPGAASLAAAAAPPASRLLYFVARGDGSSEFSETLDAHNRAVDRYQR